MYDLSSWYCLAQQNLAEDVLKFGADYIGDHYASQFTITIKESFADMINTIIAGCATLKTKKISSPRVKCYDAATVSVIDGKNLITLEDRHRHHFDLWRVYNRCVTISLHGELDFIEKMIAYIKQHIPHDMMPTAWWEFMDGDMRRSQDLQIMAAKPIYPEFYPWIGDVYAYYDKFLASDSSILLLLGDTGSGKTSFIRSLIWHAQLATTFTYDDKLLSSDGLFVDFIANETDLLVIEDADMLLTDREHEGNKVMSKFLNVSDGLVSIGKKKIVFTANLTDPGRIDPAMLRPGRCFDCQTFRRLSYKEACAAAAIAGLAEPKTDKTYSLAEVFAVEPPRTIERQFGFKA